MQRTATPNRPGGGRASRIEPLVVRRSLLRDAVFLRLLENVLRGDYRRGQRLRLDGLAEDMGVSRTPVREALVPLETLKLVSVQRYVGVVVSQWSVEQMTERLRIAKRMLDDPPSTGSPSADRFEGFWLQDCATEAGAFVELGAWYLRRRGAVISADWLVAQRAVLDMFFTDDVAIANGIDAVVDRRGRTAMVARACAAAERDELDGCAAALSELATALITLPDRFRVAASA
ncbi:GntR family transcriptional regulator [Curtobacterium sp. ISL-83]|uniref:GntR family transcriptional regulator n=1 Tax=Curtobacterium sp. ISL-83 TaxID=2819145 RepID=UPI001BEC2648|nr:GntR family transcriptional regulator [Curtobacterium sp. ISL-83]MBT2503662.1 GntR family transcriptional regulator [Curtobacterium sp. ISL-83]